MKVLIQDVQKAALAYYPDLPDGWLESADRSRYTCWPRQIAMTVAMRHTGRSYPQVGRMFGGRHHTTVMIAVRSVEERAERLPEIKAAVEAITELALRRAEFRASKMISQPVPCNGTVNVL